MNLLTDPPGFSRCSFAYLPPPSFSPDLLPIFWPLTFVTATRQDPHHTVRNFKKTVVRGSERAVDLKGNLPRPLRRVERIGPQDGRSDFRGFVRNEVGEYGTEWDTGGGSASTLVYGAKRREYVAGGAVVVDGVAVARGGDGGGYDGGVLGER